MGRVMALRWTDTIRRAALAATLSSVAVASAIPVTAQTAEGGPAAGARTGDVLWLPGTSAAGSVVPGATASLVMVDEGAAAVLATGGLEPGHVVTLWWIIFNHPEGCEHGAMGLQCGEGDLLLFGGHESVEGSVVYGAGHVVGPDGSGHLAAHVPTGDASRVVGEGPGLTNPAGAEVHLIVRTHGPIQPGLLIEQLTTPAGGCEDAPEGMGTPGDYACVEAQFAAFEAAGQVP